MKNICFLSFVVLLTACSENVQNVPDTIQHEKDYLESYYELEEARYENYLDAMAG